MAVDWSAAAFFGCDWYCVGTGTHRPAGTKGEVVKKDGLWGALGKKLKCDLMDWIRGRKAAGTDSRTRVGDNRS